MTTEIEDLARHARKMSILNAGAEKKVTIAREALEKVMNASTIKEAQAAAKAALLQLPWETPYQEPATISVAEIMNDVEPQIRPAPSYKEIPSIKKEPVEPTLQTAMSIAQPKRGRGRPKKHMSATPQIDHEKERIKAFVAASKREPVPMARERIMRRKQ